MLKIAENCQKLLEMPKKVSAVLIIIFWGTLGTDHDVLGSTVQIGVSSKVEGQIGV